ncbi:fimbrillin family protein [Sphingobacterium suaedae]|uniref:Fimbrillin family protein n=1 Tax=Sphingobacterium suaedae TaxID=1686402 RepID=A0ABW5KNY3_9SPHI
MNLLRFKRANWIVATVMLATSGMLVTSCSKDKNPTEEVSEFEGTKLVVSVAGINEGKDVPVGNLKSSANTNAAAKPKVLEFDEFDAVLAVDNNVPFKAAKALRQSTGGAGIKAAAVEDGVSYRLFLFSADGTTLVTSAQFVSGTAGTIDVSQGTSYKWVALSYNNNEDIPEVPAGSTQIALPGGKDVLYASGTVDVPTGSGNVNAPIAITFAHKFSRIAIELNSKGMFGNILSAGVAVSGLNLQTATIDVATGNLSNLTPYTATIDYSSFADVEPQFQDAKIAYAYTASPAQLTGVQVGVSSLSVQHRDNRDELVTRNFSATPVNFSFNVTPELGNSHRLLVNFVESPITAVGSTVRWARSNVYYTPGPDASRQYGFYARNIQRSSADGFFSFQGTIPGQFATTGNEGDPCALVYPAGVWRQPDRVELEPFTTSQGLLSSLLGTIGSLLGARDEAPNSTLGSNYAEYALAGGNNSAYGDAASGSNNLRFYYNGQITDVGVLTQIGQNGLLNLGLSSLSADLAGVNIIGTNIPILPTYGTQTAFWTRTQALSIPGLASAGSYAYVGFTADQAILGIPVGDPFVKAARSAELLSGVGVLGVNVLSTSFKNVRCVRN